jgi:hypothetical protein
MSEVLRFHAWPYWFLANTRIRAGCARTALDQTVNAAKDLEAALKSAIAAAASAEHFAKTVNYAVHFGSDDLTQMAATLLEEYEDLGDCVSGTTLNDAEHDLDDAGATPALMGVRR